MTHSMRPIGQNIEKNRKTNDNPFNLKHRSDTKKREPSLGKKQDKAGNYYIAINWD